MKSLELILAQATTTQQPAWTGMIPLLLIFVMFYFLFIRPQQKRQKELQKLVDGVKSGDKVVAAAGIHGVVSNVKDSTIILKVSDNVKIEVDKASISSVLSDDAPAS